MAGAIACGQTKQIKNNKQGNKQAIKQISKRANEETTKTNKPSRLFFFWSDAMVGAIACGQTKQIKTINKQSREPTQNHGLYMKIMDFTCRNRPAPHISKSLPLGFRKWLLGLADLSEGVCFLIEIVKR